LPDREDFAAAIFAWCAGDIQEFIMVVFKTVVIRMIARLMGANFFSLILWEQVHLGAMLLSMRSSATCPPYVPNLIKIVFQTMAVQIIIWRDGS
jgi:hypothetical protein